MKTNNKMKYGKTDLLPEKIEPKNETVMISVKMEGDLLDALKARAQLLGRPYQTLMKEMLRSSLGLHDDDGEEVALSDLLRRMDELNSNFRHFVEEQNFGKTKKRA